MGLVIFYASINWMPVLLKESGLSPQTATLISALFPLGGVGAVLCGVFMDRENDCSGTGRMGNGQHANGRSLRRQTARTGQGSERTGQGTGDRPWGQVR
jgi:hypothetical protein